MAKDAHDKAAEHHENAAKAHRTAAEHHGKGDHASGKKHSATALEPFYRPSFFITMPLSNSWFRSAAESSRSRISTKSKDRWLSCRASRRSCSRTFNTRT